MTGLLVQLLASIPSPSVNGIELGPFDLRAYGVLIATGVLVAWTVARRRYTQFGGDPELADTVAMRAVVFGFLGARLAYVSTHLDRFAGDDWWRVIAIWEGGLALFGGLTFGAIAAIVTLRRQGGDVPAFADAVAVGIPLAQAIGRWGNYFNQELFGTPTTLPWAVEIAPAFRPDAYAEFATFHPTFLYESLWNLLLAGSLLLVERRVRLQRGTLFLLYLAGYGTMRFLLELIRTDTTFRLLGLSRNGWVSLLVVVAAVVLAVRRERGAVSDPPMPDREHQRTI
ncbi:MAG: prolipoprotein diacylglyceryl transferase [Acidimicrobiales bacterium]|nr:prolipoprotein diacylglyceryl transferase [Acidimicrobiales bacterium]